MQPFAAPSDKEVLAAVSRTINSGETSDIAQAPHHFEIWQLAEVQEDGHIEPKRELIADCASLVRRDLRNGRHTANPEATGDPEAHRGPAGRSARIGGAELAALSSAAQGASPEASEVRQGPQGGYPPRDGQ